MSTIRALRISPIVPVIGTDAVMHYRSGYTQEDNFARLDIDKNAATITVRVFDRDARGECRYPRRVTKTTANVLPLANGRAVTIHAAWRTPALPRPIGCLTRSSSAPQ
jgi:hypothetical protein